MFCIDDTKDSDTGKPDNSKERYSSQEDKVEPDTTKIGKAKKMFQSLF